MIIRTLSVLTLSAALAACGAGTTSSGTGKAASVRSTGFTPPPRPAARPQVAPGLEAVIGSDADALTRLFGSPRLDIREDDARKLQWSDTSCILDVYLYPPAGGGRQAATYVDARRGDGRDVDRAACVAAMRKR